MSTRIFLIPVYPCDRTTFNKAWHDHLLEMVDKDSGAETLVPRLRKHCEPASVWELNRIIGYVIVSVTSADVYVDAFKRDKRSAGLFKMPRGTMKNMQLIGNHFRHVDKSNEQIAETLHQMVLDTLCSCFKGKYADIEGFNLTYQHIDYKAIAEISEAH